MWINSDFQPPDPSSPAMTLYLNGITTDYNDTSHKIVFEFHEPDRQKRIDPFTRLCQMIHVDPQKYD